MPRRLLTALAIALSLPCALPAQVDSTARLMGCAKSAFNGRPLAGVMIAVPEARKFVVTDSSGTFLLTGLPVGKQKVFVAYNGRGSEEYVFELRRGKTKRLAVVLDVEAVDLDPIVVEVRQRGGWQDLAGFFERRRFYSGWGRFYTREDLLNDHTRSIGDVLRREGIYTRCVEEGCVPTKWYRGEACAVPVFVDGTLFYANEYETILIEEVRGIEIYRPGMEPPEFTGGWRPFTARARAGPHNYCGRISIWTR